MNAPSITQPIIAIDAMGGDFAPEAIVEGAILGARLHKVAIQLVGQTDKIQAELAKHDTKGLSIELVQASEVIGMDEAATALRQKRDASIAVAAKQVGKKKAQGLVAAGSTGAAMAAALFNMGRIPGVERPAIGLVLPNWEQPCLLLDAGANADCTPDMLMDFARMGTVFMRALYQLPEPRVGLLNIGTEEGKGNTLCQAVYPRLRQEKTINFVGNVEGRHLFLGGCDVAVADGFSGNVALKSAEGVVTLFGKLMKHELTASPWAKVTGALAKPALARAKKHVDHEEFGGALLLGVKGVCVIAHGGSSPNAIQNAIRVAKQGIVQDVVARVQSISENKASDEEASPGKAPADSESTGASA